MRAGQVALFNPDVCAARILKRYVVNLPFTLFTPAYATALEKVTKVAGNDKVPPPFLPTFLGGEYSKSLHSSATPRQQRTVACRYLERSWISNLFAPLICHCRVRDATQERLHGRTRLPLRRREL